MSFLLLTSPDITRLGQIIAASRENPQARLDVTISLVAEDSDASVQIVFNGVRELNVKELNVGSVLGPLKAHDLRDRQLEGIAYKIMDFEEEKLSFYCERFAEDKVKIARSGNET